VSRSIYRHGRLRLCITVFIFIYFVLMQPCAVVGVEAFFHVPDRFNWCYFLIYYSCNCCCYYYNYYCDYYKEYYCYHHQHQPLHFKSAPCTKIYLLSSLVCVGLRIDPSVRKLSNYNVFNTPTKCTYNKICVLIIHLMHFSALIAPSAGGTMFACSKIF